MEDNSVAKRSENQCPPATGPYPWLVYSHDKENKGQTFWSISDPNNTHHRRIPELENKTCLASSHGWCVLSDKYDHRSYFIWNPITFEKIELPKLGVDYGIGFCVLSSSPSEIGCKIVLFASQLPMIIFHVLGDEQWIELDYRDELKRGIYGDGNKRMYEWETLSNPIICNEKLYAESRFSGKLFVIDEIKKDRIVLQSLGVTYPRGMPNTFAESKFFVESFGEIYGIKITLGGINYIEEIVYIEVYKLDFSCLVWEKVERFKNSELFFICDRYSISCSAINPEIQGNYIYYERNNLYSYNIEDGSLSVIVTSEQSPSSFWIMPDTRLLSATKENQGKERKENVVLEKGGVDQLDCFISLPSHIVLLIVKRLVLVSYLNFRATCRFFRSLAPPIESKIDLNLLENHSLSPLLVFFEKDRVCTFVNPKNGEKKFIYLPQQLLGSVICYSKDGWLLMPRDRAHTYCFNPFTAEILKFPDTPYPRPNENRSTVFSISPTSSECLVVDLHRFCNYDNKICVDFAFRGDTEWFFQEFYEDYDFRFSDNSPVFYNKQFYYLSEDGNLGILRILKISDEMDISWKILPKPERPCSNYQQNFLVECDEELLSVFVGKFGDWVYVFKLNQSTMTWIRVESLGKYMIFVSRLSSFSAIAKAPEMENKIYFPRFYGQSMVFYSLDSNKYHSFDNIDLPIEFYKTRERLYCGWIEPR